MDQSSAPHRLNERPAQAVRGLPHGVDDVFRNVDPGHSFHDLAFRIDQGHEDARVPERLGEAIQDRVNQIVQLGKTNRGFGTLVQIVEILHREST